MFEIPFTLNIQLYMVGIESIVAITQLLALRPEQQTFGRSRATDYT